MALVTHWNQAVVSAPFGYDKHAGASEMLYTTSLAIHTRRQARLARAVERRRNLLSSGSDYLWPSKCYKGASLDSRWAATKYLCNWRKHAVVSK
jgi:hypothetical protein